MINAMKKQHAVSQITGDGMLFLLLNGSGGRLLRPSRPWPEEKQIQPLYSGEAAATGEKTKSDTFTPARLASPE